MRSSSVRWSSSTHLCCPWFSFRRFAGSAMEIRRAPGRAFRALRRITRGFFPVYPTSRNELAGTELDHQECGSGVFRLVTKQVEGMHRVAALGQFVEKKLRLGTLRDRNLWAA